MLYLEQESSRVGRRVNRTNFEGYEFQSSSCPSIVDLKIRQKARENSSANRRRSFERAPSLQLGSNDIEHSGGKKEKKDKSKKKKSKKDKKEKKERSRSRDDKVERTTASKHSAPTGTIEPIDNPDDITAVGSANYKTKQEFKAAIKKVEEKRLIEVRIWLLCNILIFIVTAPSLHISRWERLDYKGQAALIIQGALAVPIVMGIVISYLGGLEVIYVILLLQTLQTLLFNYLSFGIEDTNNF